METRNLERRAAVHAALADPVRLAIVDELALSDRSPRELGAHLDVRSNLLAHHLDVLEAAGLVRRSVSYGDRRRRYVRLVPDGLAALSAVPVLQASGVVFVCTRNSARSQLAAAMWNRQSPLGAVSAGTDPAERVHPGAVQAARRRRLDLDGATPTALDLGDLDGRVVVTVCDLAHEELGAIERTGAPLLHWSVPDPADPTTGVDFDVVADQLDRRVRALVPSVHPF